MANTLTITPLPLASRVGAFTGTELDLGARRVVQVEAVVVALASGTATITLESSPDKITWRSLATTPALTAGARAVLAVLAADQYVRCVTATGVANTIMCSGTADDVYATQTDVNTYGLQTAATTAISADQWARILVASSAEADSYLGATYKLPLTAWGSDLRMHVSQIAALALVAGRGFTPGGPDEILVKRRDDAIAWLRRVSLGQISPSGLADSTPDTVEGAFAVYSDTPRGWSFA